MTCNHEIGSKLRQALEARGCVLSAAEARTLSVALIDLATSGLLVAETSTAAVHGSRAPQNAGAVVGSGDQSATAPTYNMGQSLYMQGGDRE